jgi:hypothetical protein
LRITSEGVLEEVVGGICVAGVLDGEVDGEGVADAESGRDGGGDREGGGLLGIGGGNGAGHVVTDGGHDGIELIGVERNVGVECFQGGPGLGHGSVWPDERVSVSDRNDTGASGVATFSVGVVVAADEVVVDADEDAGFVDGAAAGDGIISKVREGPPLGHARLAG